MTIARYISAGDIVNRAALEVGLASVGDPFSSTDPSFRQLFGLLNSGCQDLVAVAEWQQLQKQGTIATTGTPNQYAVPADFSHFIPQTGWKSGDFQGLGGPLNPQLWAIATGQNLASPIYISYRETQNQFWLYPTDTAAGQTLNYEYIRRTWVVNGSTYRDRVEANDDIVQFEPVLVVNLLKWKFLSAKGFPSQDAKNDFLSSLSLWKGKGVSAPILSMARGKGRNFDPLLTPANAGDTGFG